MHITLGVEEEVFVLEKDRLTPTLQSLDYMRRLLWHNPKRYGKCSASNFSRGADAKACLMSSVEIATGVHDSADSLIDDLLNRRVEFGKATEGALVVPIGSLFTLAAPSNTSGLHVHVGVPTQHRTRVFDNLAYFLPPLAVASASSPFADGAFFGMSYRMARPHALGPLKEDNEYRFQDLIITKRLGTIEVRVLDPMPEIERMRTVLNAIYAIASYDGHLPFDREEYNRERPVWTQFGLNDWVRAHADELQKIHEFPAKLMENTLSARLAEVAEKKSILEAYQMVDAIWRDSESSCWKPFSPVRLVTGLAGYYALRLPYMAYKGYKEWKGATPSLS
jgi:gamma-glutamyl:cysteine ligase YbdK (ATP-grasp superfamily)